MQVLVARTRFLTPPLCIPAHTLTAGAPARINISLSFFLLLQSGLTGIRPVCAMTKWCSPRGVSLTAMCGRLFSKDVGVTRGPVLVVQRDMTSSKWCGAVRRLLGLEKLWLAVGAILLFLFYFFFSSFLVGAKGRVDGYPCFCCSWCWHSVRRVVGTGMF